MDEYVADDFVEHQNGVQGIGPDAVKEIIKGLHQSLSEMTFPSRPSSRRGHGLVRSRVTAKNTLPFLGWPATGKRSRSTCST